MKYFSSNGGVELKGRLFGKREISCFDRKLLQKRQKYLQCFAVFLNFEKYFFEIKNKCPIFIGREYIYLKFHIGLKFLKNIYYKLNFHISFFF